MKWLSFSLLLLFSIFMTSCESSENAAEQERRLDEISRYFMIGELELAEQLLVEEFLIDYPENALGWNILGNIYMEINMDEDAHDAYSKAIEYDENLTEAYTGLGVINRRAGNYDEAAEYYYRSIELDPYYAQAYTSLAVVELKRYNIPKAVELGEKAFQLDGQDPVIAANLACFYHYNGQFKKRDEAYRQADILGYHSLESLVEIFNGEFTLFDE